MLLIFTPTLFDIISSATTSATNELFSLYEFITLSSAYISLSSCDLLLLQFLRMHDWANLSSTHDGLGWELGTHTGCGDQGYEYGIHLCQNITYACKRMCSPRDVDGDSFSFRCSLKIRLSNTFWRMHLHIAWMYA
jgi:hypothetical protein